MEQEKIGSIVTLLPVEKKKKNIRCIIIVFLLSISVSYDSLAEYSSRHTTIESTFGCFGSTDFLNLLKSSSPFYYRVFRQFSGPVYMTRSQKNKKRIWMNVFLSVIMMALIQLMHTILNGRKGKTWNVSTRPQYSNE